MNTPGVFFAGKGAEGLPAGCAPGNRAGMGTERGGSEASGRDSYNGGADGRAASAVSGKVSQTGKVGGKITWQSGQSI